MVLSLNSWRGVIAFLVGVLVFVVSLKYQHRKIISQNAMSASRSIVQEKRDQAINEARRNSQTTYSYTAPGLVTMK